MAQAKMKTHYGWIVLAVGMLVVFAALGLARLGYSMVLPAMQAGLGMDNTAAGALASANLAAYLVLALLGGALASHFGPRAVIAAGLALVGVGMIATGTAPSAPVAALWRALSGVGSGASNVPVMGLLAGWFAVRRRGLASGIAVAGSSLALIVLGPTVPRLLEMLGEDGWRVYWFSFGGLTLLIAALAALLLRNHPHDLGLQPVGAFPDEANSNSTRGSLRWSEVYRSSAIWSLGLVYTAYGLSYIIYITFFIKALVTDGGLAARQAGNLFMLMGWFALPCGLIWGHVSDVIGRKGALIIVHLLQAIAFGLFALWPVLPGFALSAILFGLTAWSIPAIMAATCGDMVGARMAPAALGFITVFLGIGQAVGPTLAGAIADATNSLLPAMLLASAVALLGALGSALLRPVIVCEEQL